MKIRILPDTVDIKDVQFENQFLLLQDASNNPIGRAKLFRDGETKWLNVVLLPYPEHKHVTELLSEGEKEIIVKLKEGTRIPQLVIVPSYHERYEKITISMEVLAAEGQSRDDVVKEIESTLKRFFKLKE